MVARVAISFIDMKNYLMRRSEPITPNALRSL